MATIDLTQLVKNGIFSRSEKAGAGVVYKLTNDWLKGQKDAVKG